MSGSVHEHSEHSDRSDRKPKKVILHPDIYRRLAIDRVETGETLQAIVNRVLGQCLSGSDQREPVSLR